MKSFSISKYYTLLFFFILSCKKNDEHINTSTNISQSSAPLFSAMVNGALMKGDSILALLQIDTIGQVRIVTIAGLDSFNIIAVGLYDYSTSNYVSPVTYNFSPTLPGGFFEYFKILNSDTLMQYHMLAGTISITNCNSSSKKISGTFRSSFIDLFTNDTIKITNGIFSNVKYSLEYL